jgi:hypothetical protein
MKKEEKGVYYQGVAISVFNLWECPTRQHRRCSDENGCPSWILTEKAKECDSDYE